MRRGVLALLVLAAPMLAGCGLRPLYAGGPGGAPGAAELGLSEINVPLLPERNGQLLRLALQARLDPEGAGRARRYDLVVSYGMSADVQGIDQASSAPSRLRLVGVATWRLLAMDAQRTTLANGVARSADGMNLFDQQFFAQDLESEAVQRRIADAVADQLTMQLAAYFHKSAGK
jgi:LPS-assembly lipoprotein